MLPNRTLARKGEECHGAKKSKERVTLMFCSNADGSEKYPLAVIGKFKNPRCFKNVTNMPVHYYAQKNAWMDRYIFKQWLEAFDKKITKQGRNVLLFYDNVGSHIIDDVSLRSTTIVTLPPNTTSRLQPMDQGIIEACKKRYRSRLLQRVVVDLKAGTETKISLLDAIHLISRAWNDVTEKSIANCYRKAGFKFDTVVENEPTEDTADRIAEDRNVWNFISKHLNVPTDQTFEDYVNCDENLSVDDTELTEAEIVAEVRGDAETSSSSDGVLDDNLEEDDIFEGETCKTPTEALKCIRQLRSYISSNDLTGYNELAVLEDTVMKSAVKAAVNLKQKKVTDFFMTQAQGDA